MILSIIFILLIIVGIGLPLSLILQTDRNLARVGGTSFLLGIGIFTILMFLGNLIGIRFSLLNISLLLIIISAPLLLLNRRTVKRYFIDLGEAIQNANLEPIEKVILIFIGFMIFSSLINTLYWPVHMWDSLVLYDFRAHVFAQTGFMKEAFLNSYFLAYPLLTSLAHTIIYLAGGRYPQFIYTFFYASLGVSFYGLLRDFVSRKAALIFTLVLLIVQPIFYHSTFSYTNLPYAVFFSLGIMYLFMWDKKEKIGYLILSALLIGFSNWTRAVEPFWLVALFSVLVVSIYRRKLWGIVVFSGIFFPIQQMWKIFLNSLTGITTSTAGEVAYYAARLPGAFDFNRWMNVIRYLNKYVIIPWGVIFFTFIISMVALFIIKKQKKYFLIFLVPVLLLMLLIIGTYIFSLGFSSWEAIGDAVNRLSMLFYPFFIFCIALVVGEISKTQS